MIPPRTQLKVPQQTSNVASKTAMGVGIAMTRPTTRALAGTLCKSCVLDQVMFSAAKSSVVVGGFLSLVACTDYSTHEVLV